MLTQRSQSRLSRHIKRRLLRSVLTIRNLANFNCVQDLATIYVLRDIELSLLCQLWYAPCVYAYAHTQTITYEYRTRVILYSAWASRCRSNTMGNARASGSGTTIVGFHAFFLYVIVKRTNKNKRVSCLSNTKAVPLQYA